MNFGHVTAVYCASQYLFNKLPTAIYISVSNLKQDE